MGSLAGDSDQNKQMNDDPSAQFAHAPITTQPFDPQMSPFPSEKGGNADGLQLEQSTMPFYDTVPVEDAFETQVVNLGGETQVPDDLDFLENLDTQLIEEFDNLVDLDSDGEGTDRTEVLGDSDAFSDDELGTRGNCDLLDGEKILYTPLCEQGEEESMKQPSALTDKQHSSGSTPRFASIRAESLRASGLAAYNSALKGNNRESCSLLTGNNRETTESLANNHGSETKVWEEVHQIHDTGRSEDEVRGFRKGNKCKPGCSSVRKLFTEDSLVENDGLPRNSDNTVGGKEVLQLPNFDDGLAGLSYIDSQEPGELTQANALECVERLIDGHKVLFDDDIDQGKTGRGKSNSIAPAKGPQSLAKKNNDRGTNEKTGIFDWDDQREDEGGGDLFRRRKEDFFGRENLGQRFIRKPLKSKGNKSGGRNNEGQPNVQSEIMVQSDSRILLHNLKVNDNARDETEKNIRNDLVVEFNEQANVDKSTGQLEGTMNSKYMAETLNIGLDTQMAAEAMEALFYGENNANHGANDAVLGQPANSEPSLRRKTKNSVNSKQCFFDNNCDAGVTTRRSKRTNRITVRSSKQSSVSSPKHSENVRKASDTDPAMTRKKRAKSEAEELLTESAWKNVKEISSQIVKPRKAKGAVESCQPDDINRCNGTTSNRGRSMKKRRLSDELASFTPIAHRTRKSSVVSQAKNTENVLDCGEETNCPKEIGAFEQNGAGTISLEASKTLNANGKCAELASGQSGEPENSVPKLIALSNDINFPKRRRSSRSLSRQLNELHNVGAQSVPSGEPGNIGKSLSGHKNSQNNTRTTSTNFNIKRRTRSSISTQPESSSVYRSSEHVSTQILHEAGLCKPARNHKSIDENGNKISKNVMGAEAVKHSGRKADAEASPSAQNKVHITSDESPRGTTKPSELACTSPADCMTPVNAASPICMGNGYFKQSCKKNLSRSYLAKEISMLCAARPEPISVPRDSRKRKDLAGIRVLFSHHLDEDIIKQQRKIAERLKVSIASSISDATHFITDKFVRTRNMLEAVASGKPVVTHLWLENVGRANYYIDEQKYILRDTKKEKEFGFNMPVTLANARQRPLLQGQRVLITPNAKPGREIISSLIKAVNGQAVERVGRSALKDDAMPDNLLILSCEEDYEVCVPFLEKGAAVYSSELLLNGIVTQKLEYERHRLFVNHVKRTRSTIWLKKDGCNFTPVTNHK